MWYHMTDEVGVMSDFLSLKPRKNDTYITHQTTYSYLRQYS